MLWHTTCHNPCTALQSKQHWMTLSSIGEQKERPRCFLRHLSCSRSKRRQHILELNLNDWCEPESSGFVEHFKEWTWAYAISFWYVAACWLYLQCLALPQLGRVPPMECSLMLLQETNWTCRFFGRKGKGVRSRQALQSSEKQKGSKAKRHPASKDWGMGRI